MSTFVAWTCNGIHHATMSRWGRDARVVLTVKNPFVLYGLASEFTTVQRPVGAKASMLVGVAK
jgi:hypothetical protein